MLDQCATTWQHLELGTFLEGVLRQYKASEYRTTLIRNGRFPPGPPSIDEYTVMAHSHVRVPLPHLHSVVAARLQASLMQQPLSFHISETNLPWYLHSSASKHLDGCMLKPRSNGVLAEAHWWQRVGDLLPKTGRW